MKKTSKKGQKRGPKRGSKMTTFWPLFDPFWPLFDHFLTLIYAYLPTIAAISWHQNWPLFDHFLTTFWPLFFHFFSTFLTKNPCTFILNKIDKNHLFFAKNPKSPFLSPERQNRRFLGGSVFWPKKWPFYTKI